MLEDESGRVRLVGRGIEQAQGTFVTGTIMAALGAELPSGDFQVLDYCFAGAPEQELKDQGNDSKMDMDHSAEWIAIVSGLEMGNANAAADVRVQMLADWLVGEAGGDEVSHSEVVIPGPSDRLTSRASSGHARGCQDHAFDPCGQFACSSRLGRKRIIRCQAGEYRGDSSFKASMTFKLPLACQRRYGYDSSLFSAKPTEVLDGFLADVLPSLPIDLLPGETDPTAPTMPQQPLHQAMLPLAAEFERFTLTTNPYWFDLGGARSVVIRARCLNVSVNWH